MVCIALKTADRVGEIERAWIACNENPQDMPVFCRLDDSIQNMSDFMELKNELFWQNSLTRCKEIRQAQEDNRIERATAVLMGTHERLGAEARIGVLDPYLLREFL
jgi:hypothetical protein